MDKDGGGGNLFMFKGCIEIYCLLNLLSIKFGLSYQLIVQKLGF